MEIFEMIERIRLVLTILFPDKNGYIKDITLGFDEMEDYYNTDTGFGAYVGRNANRIKNATAIKI